MLSAIRKKLGKSNGADETDVIGQLINPTAGVVAMDPALRKKFAHGVQYNLKILIKGDRNVGKTCLFQRLQGKPFLDEYVPTEQIQVASIQWNYRATDDVIKVDVWDVVDKSRVQRKKMDGLKLNNHVHEFEEATLDAQFIDVYKGAHGVILIFDVTKAWTWDYVQREITQIPANLPVLILANRLDMSHHRQIRREQASYYVENIDRGLESAKVRYAEASMRNGFGLKLLYLFFNIPFLILQRETLLRQLETNAKEIELSFDEIDLYQESDENNYEKFTENLNQKRRNEAEKTAPKATTDVVISSSQQNKSPEHRSMPNLHNNGTDDGNGAAKSAIIQQQPSPIKPVAQSNKNSPRNSTASDLKPAIFLSIFKHPVKNVEEFMPDDHVDASFFDDSASKSQNLAQKSTNVVQRPKNLPLTPAKSDSEDETVINTMVTTYEEDLDSTENDDDDHGNAIYANERGKNLKFSPTKICAVQKAENITPMAYNVPIMSSPDQVAAAAIFDQSEECCTCDDDDDGDHNVMHNAPATVHPSDTVNHSLHVKNDTAIGSPVKKAPAAGSLQSDQSTPLTFSAKDLDDWFGGSDSAKDKPIASPVKNLHIKHSASKSSHHVTSLIMDSDEDVENRLNPLVKRTPVVDEDSDSEDALKPRSQMSLAEDPNNQLSSKKPKKTMKKSTAAKSLTRKQFSDTNSNPSSAPSPVSAPIHNIAAASNAPKLAPREKVKKKSKMNADGSKSIRKSTKKSSITTDFFGGGTANKEKNGNNDSQYEEL